MTWSRSGALCCLLGGGSTASIELGLTGAPSADSSEGFAVGNIYVDYQRRYSPLGSYAKCRLIINPGLPDVAVGVRNGRNDGHPVVRLAGPVEELLDHVVEGIRALDQRHRGSLSGLMSS